MGQLGQTHSGSCRCWSCQFLFCVLLYAVGRNIIVSGLIYTVGRNTGVGVLGGFIKAVGRNTVVGVLGGLIYAVGRNTGEGVLGDLIYVVGVLRSKRTYKENSAEWRPFSISKEQCFKTNLE